MLTTAFNCVDCKQPVERAEKSSRSCYYHLERNVILCGACTKWPAKQHFGLMKFLNQLAFRKREDGWEYTLPINDPLCCQCQRGIKVKEGYNALIGNAGHFCEGCSSGKQAKDADLRMDSCLMTFIKDVEIYELKQRLHEIEQDTDQNRKRKRAVMVEVKQEEAEPDSLAIKICGQCLQTHHVEMLYKCGDDDDVIICGVCAFDNHQGHSVVKLLQSHLNTFQETNDNKYMDTLKGLHANLRHAQWNIDNAVEKVVKAGKDRLTQISTCKTFKEAETIATKIEKAAEKFEKHCEAYTPVARELAARLNELEEELVQDNE